jgi:hypothetical protein
MIDHALSQLTTKSRTLMYVDLGRESVLHTDRTSHVGALDIKPSRRVLVRKLRCRYPADHATPTCECGQITSDARHRAGMHAARWPRSLTCRREITGAN